MQQQRLTHEVFKLLLIMLSQLPMRALSRETLIKNYIPENMNGCNGYFPACENYICGYPSNELSTVGQVLSGQASSVSQVLPPIQYITVEFEVALKTGETSNYFEVAFNNGGSNPARQFDLMECIQYSAGYQEVCDAQAYFIRGWWTTNTVAPTFSYLLRFEGLHEFLMYSFRVYVQLCHPTCLTCDFNNPNVCLTCAYGTPNSLKKCECQLSNQILHEGTCITGCDSAFGFIQVGDICIQLPPHCILLNSQGKCSLCEAFYELYGEDCLIECPQFQKIKSGTNQCEESITMTDHVVLARDFYQEIFSMEIIEVSGYTINVVGISSSDSNNFWKGYQCQNYMLILGHAQGRKGSSIVFPDFTITHKFVQISFFFVLIDAEINQTTIIIELEFGSLGATQLVIDNSKASPFSLCGEITEDYVGVFSQSIEWGYGMNKLTITVKNDSYAEAVSLGIREIEIVQFNCNPLCTSCTRELCLTCDPGYTPDTSGGCKVCPNDVPGAGGICELCYAGCTTCSGTASNQCKSCQDNRQLSGSTCIECPLGVYNSITDCLKCDPSCISCKDTVSTCLTCPNAACTKCPNNKPVFLGKCVDSCVGLGDGVHLNVKTNECECSENYSILILLNGILTCSNGVPFGFYCPSIIMSPCFSCKDNCEVCATQSTCKLCQSGFFLWNNECVSDCFPSLSIIENNVQRTCECETGKVLKKRDASDIASSTDSKIKSELNSCMVPLELILVELVNALSKPKDRESIPLDMQNNYVILTFNRRPTDVEFATFGFYIMKSTLTREKEYQLVSTLLETGKASILIEIQVAENRRINNFSILTDELNDTILVNNFVLISPSLSKQIQNDSSKSISNGFESLSSIFVNQDSAFLNYLSRFSKEFQMVCKLSNFVQLLTPIYFMNDLLPPLTKYGSLFGASFIFDRIPSQVSVEFTPESSSTNKLKSAQTRNMQRNLEDSSQQNVTESAVHSLTQMLAGFGMTSSILDNCLGVHLIVFASVLMKLVCYIGRRTWVGKQYTILVMDKITNFIISYIQGSITVIFAIIGYAVSSGEGVALASIYLICYVAVYVNMIVLTFYRDAEYLKGNIPNFFQEINHTARAAKFYLFFAFFKKHLALLFLFVLFQSQFVCCILNAILFFFSACMLAYYRYFTSKLISFLKVAQEISICTLFVLLAIALQKYKQVLEADIITNDALMNSIKWANIVLVSMVVCISISFLFSVFRSIKSVLELREAWRKRQEDKKRLKEEELLIHQSISIQMQQGFNSIVKVKKVQLQDLPKKEGFGELNE